MRNDYLTVAFKGELSTANNCLCNACHFGGYVVKLEIPVTCYTNRGKLKTKYHPFWLCRKCRDKLVKALEWEGAEDGET